MITAKTRFKRRPYEIQALVACRQERVITLFWTRRGRKSTTLGSIAFDEMSKASGRTVISASASLLLGTELVQMTVSAAEQAILVANEAEAVNAVFAQSAAAAKLDYRCANSETGKVYKNMTREDFADLYSSKRLEMRLYHSDVDYSRQLVIAPNPGTARGWRGTVLRDECGFTKPNLEEELQHAVDPIFRDCPDLKMIYASNLPRDDRHPYFTQTLPPNDAHLPVSDKGNFYRNENGMLIHRVTLADAYAAGHVLYDNRGQPMSYEAFATDPQNRGQMPYNYALTHIMGGTAAIDLLAISTSQSLGALKCHFAAIDTDAEFDKAMEIILTLLGTGPIGLGFDPATTTNAQSNPSSLTITEDLGFSKAQRGVIIWKTYDEATARGRVKKAVDLLLARPAAPRPRRICVDASSERYFCDALRKQLSPIIPVQLVVSGESMEVPGLPGKTNYKTFMGDTYSAAINEGRYILPAAHYLRKDHRQVVKDKGSYTCTVDSQDGGHGDTFDSGKLADLALSSKGTFAFTPVKRPDRENLIPNKRRRTGLKV